MRLRDISSKMAKFLSKIFFGVNKTDATRLVLFPTPLTTQEQVLFLQEYIITLRMPIVWFTVLFFALILIGLCWWFSRFPYILEWLICSLVLGILCLLHIFHFWDYSGKWGPKIQLRLLGITLTLLANTIAIGVAGSWYTMTLAQVGIITTIIGSILGAAAVILSFSRTHYLLFMLGLMTHGIYFMFTHHDILHVVMGSLFCAGLISFSVINFMEYAKQRRLFDARQRLAVEHQRSESLLLNILPSKIADELKALGSTKPVRIEKATVMFTDFVGFTRISERLTAEEVVDELDKCFSYFDQVTEKYGLEKLKTIGDSFMCAGGLPSPNETHALDCCLAALEIQAFMNQMREIKKQQGFDYWELRLGMNTGPLVAGVVGHKKFAYDVWGDTVNTASRLESTGLPGKINISPSTYEAVRHLFACEHRGQVYAKNKGDIDMYFLTGIFPEFSIGGEGRVPNAKFKANYDALARK